MEFNTMIQLIRITKTFNAGKPNRFNALRRIDLKIELNRVTLFKGSSGSGKTTILSIIGCMVRPTSGRVLLKGREITGLSERFLSKIRRESFGFVFQHFNLINGVTVLENVMLPAYPTAKGQRQVMARALFLFETLEIHSKAYVRVQYLSGGEQQRTAIARALINDPEFIIADEPTAHLNTDLARQFLDIVAMLKNQGKTVLMASHDPILFDSSVVDRVIELRDGRVLEGG
jgi:putative ABC transport system ATP-binding protein